MKDIIKVTLFGLLTFPIIVACSDDDENTDLGPLVPAEEVFGKANDVFSAEEWYPGGQLGTTEKASYSAPAPALEGIDGMEEDFNVGEGFFEKLYTFEQNPLLGYAMVASIAIPPTVMANDRRNIVPTPLAMVICSSSTIPTTMLISLR